MEVAVFPLLRHPAWGEQRQSSVSQESPYLKRLPPESNVLPFLPLRIPRTANCTSCWLSNVQLSSEIPVQFKERSHTSK